MMRDRQEDRRQTDTGEGRADHCVKYRARAEGRVAEIVMGYKEKRKKRPRERDKPPSNQRQLGAEKF